MRPSPVWHVAWLAVSVGLLAGCETSSDRGSARKQSNVVSTQGLPELDDYLPPLDDDRIQIAAPKGWYVPPWSSKYIVRFQRGVREKYPCVIVTAEDYKEEGIFNVSEENVRKFAEQVAAAVKKDKSAVRPIQIGKFVGVAYRKRGKEPKSVSKVIELLYLDTVVAGRKYSIHLRTGAGSLKEGEPYLYAVVNGMEFLKAEREEKPKEESKKDEGLKLDLDKLDDLLKK